MIDHQLEIVAVDVVVEAAGDGVNAVIALLPGIPRAVGLSPAAVWKRQRCLSTKNIS